MSQVVLIGLNAKYIHAAFGLRCLLANLGPLRDQARLREFTIHDTAADIVETVLRDEPGIVGLGVYVWNAELAERVCALFARVAPDVTVVLGGPEVSHELDDQPIAKRLADYVIPGEADQAFAALVGSILSGDPPPRGVVPAPLPDLETLRLPYDEYTDEDVQNRIVYVEASRGCPYRCEFCLSSLDRSVRTIPMTKFLAAMGDLLDRGVRHFKFVDRTFNLDLSRSIAVLDFFAERITPDLLLHFEMIPDRLPERLRRAIVGFPSGSLQFEVGIQTFDEVVAANIDRKQDAAKIEANLAWSRRATGAHIHADLIVGLPGETVEGFGRGFDRLYRTGVQEIQVGILKRLRGAPIARHDLTSGMVYDPSPPCSVLRTGCVSFAEMREMSRFARFWDLLANSGHYECTLRHLFGDRSVFDAFRDLSRFLYDRFARAHAIAAPKIVLALFEYAATLGMSEEDTAARMIEDHLRSGRLQLPEFLRPYLTKGDRLEIGTRRGNPAARRQRVHLAQAGEGQSGRAGATGETSAGRDAPGP